MKNVSLLPDAIVNEIISHIKEPESIFIFSTDVVLNSWVDYLITHPELSGVSALPLEKFIAWDNFKSRYVKATKDGLTAIPSILRKLFVQDFIARNAELPEEQRLQVIINPDDSMAASASSFSDWIASNLSSLHYWKKRMDRSAGYGEPDAEDKDYLKLYESYKSFLEANNLFEPNWIEEINFGENKKHFHIFYPELLEDFRDYEETFKGTENITVYTLPQDVPPPAVNFYSDSRRELRQTILRIIELYQTGKADFSEIAVSVPDIETWRPYIEREFTQYSVPFVIKAGTSLTEHSAGKIFREISNCHKENFTFDSVRALLLDESVPWKEELKELREGLVREGNRMRCVISVEKDVWLQALNSKLNRLDTALKHSVSEEKKLYYSEEINRFTKLTAFYHSVQNLVEAFYSEKKNSFADIIGSWNNFKSEFLSDNFDEKSDLIIGRCITELNSIIQIEKDFADCNLKINSPFDFFLETIEGKKYQMQTTESGVTIYPYKLSAAACIKYQFVMDSSQSNLDVPYKRLTFLNTEKRRRLHLIEEDKMLRATEVFIKLYAKTSAGGDSSFVHFSAAENTFSGFAIPHSALNPFNEKSEYLKNEINRLNKTDFILAEKEFILKNSEAPVQITRIQKEQLEQWQKTAVTKDVPYSVNEKIKKTINWVLDEHRRDPEKSQTGEGKFFITARGDLEKFFPCPRNWLFVSALRLTEDSLDTQLMKPFDMGSLNHKILELFTSQFMGTKLPFYDEESDEFKLNGEKYFPDIISIVEKAIKEPSDFRDSPLVVNMLESQSFKIAQNITGFLKTLLIPYGSIKDKDGEICSFSGIGNCTVHSMEEYIIRQDSDKAYNWSGKLDLLLKTPNGSWMIIDYKNSKGSIHKCELPDANGMLSDFQMPVYARLVETKGGQITTGAYYAIKDKISVTAIDELYTESKKNSDGESEKLYTRSYEAFEKNLEALDEYAEIFNTTVKNMNFVPHTSEAEGDKLNVKNYINCINCSFSSICRTTYTIGRKEIK